MKIKKPTQQIKVRACQIQSTTNPEWGSFGVMEDRGTYYEIHGRSGGRILYKDEADKFWRVI